MKKNLFKKLLAAALVVVMAIPAIYLGGAKEEAKAANAQTDLLQVVAQTTQQKVVGGDYDGKYVLRFASTVSEEDLETVDSVGFEIDVAGVTYRSTTTNVFTRIDSSTAGAEFTYSPKVVDVDSAYFFTAKYAVDEADVADTYTVRAFAKDAEGTYVYGPKRIVSVADGLGDTALVAFPGTTDATEVYVNGVSVEIAGQTDANIFVRVPRAGLKSANSLTLTSDSEGQNIISGTVYKYYGNTAYTAVDTSWYDVYAEAEDVDTYFVATPNDMYGLSQLVEDGETFLNKVIYVVSDITINTGDASTWTATNAPANYWDPIGGDGWGDARFEGTFDGQGHSISGVYVNGTDSTDGKYCAALFEVINPDAVIKNFALVNSYFYGKTGHTGSIAGNAYGGLIENVYSSAIVECAGNNTGGFVGEAAISSAEKPLTFVKCWFDGVVKNNSDRAGGLAGAYYTAYALGEGVALSMTDCLVTGTIINGAKYSGGFYGYSCRANVTVTRCFMAGTVDTGGACNKVGSIVGWQQGGKCYIDGTNYMYTTFHNDNRPYGVSSSVQETITRIDLTKGEVPAEKATALLEQDAWTVGADGTPILAAYARLWNAKF